MELVNRRAAIGITAIAASLGAVEVSATTDDPKPRMTDRECVMAAGMTDAEADCWAMAAKLAGMFFNLPEQHPADNAEVTQAIHILQNKLLSRPTYRKYLELAKKAHEK